MSKLTDEIKEWISKNWTDGIIYDEDEKQIKRMVGKYVLNTQEICIIHDLIDVSQMGDELITYCKNGRKMKKPAIKAFLKKIDYEIEDDCWQDYDL
jgi:hypothetical protein